MMMNGLPRRLSFLIFLLFLVGSAQIFLGQTAGNPWAWGSNSDGQLGNGTETNSNVPVQSSTATDYIAVAGGSYHSLGLKSDGTLWAWGYNGDGEFGDGSNAGSLVPVQGATGLMGVTAIAAGAWHSVALKSDGTVWAWGWNGYGQLGNGSINPSLTPVQVSGLTNVKAIAGGW